MILFSSHQCTSNSEDQRVEREIETNRAMVCNGIGADKGENEWNEYYRQMVGSEIHSLVKRCSEEREGEREGECIKEKQK